jgi:hypothetical protein
MVVRVIYKVRRTRMSNLATRKVKGATGGEDKQQSSHYIVAKSSGNPDDRKYLNFFSSEGEYGEMISVTVKDGFSIEKFLEFAAYVQDEVEAGNKVYLNFNASRQQ